MEGAASGALDVALEVLAELDLDLVLDRVVEAARQLTGARYAALGVLDTDKRELSRFITRGLDEATKAAIGALPRGRGVLGALIENPAPLRLADVGADPRSFGFPPGHPPMHAFLGLPILIDGEPFGNLYLTEKDGGQFTDADEHALAVLAQFAAVAIAHARRYTDTKQHRDELERTVATLEATVQIARAVGAETDLNAVLELIVQRGRALVSARALIIALEQRGHLLLAAGAGELPEGLIGMRLPVADSLAALAMTSRRPQRLEHEPNMRRFTERGLGQMIDASAGLVVPLIFRGEQNGALLATDRLDDGPGFTSNDERLLQAFASSAAIAVATAKAVASDRTRQRLAAAEEERRRWARELHDETLQSFSAVRTGLALAKRSGDAERIATAIDEALEMVDEGVSNLRMLITDLRPASLDELGTPAAIEALVERLQQRGVQVQVELNLAYEQGKELTRHTAELETALYRITQEALTNAIKHGAATSTIVRIIEDGTTVRLTIKDDGAGFDPECSRGGFGLLGMRERVELLSGTLRIDSAPGRGTTVEATIPVTRRPRGEGAGTRDKDDLSQQHLAAEVAQAEG